MRPAGLGRRSFVMRRRQPSIASRARPAPGTCAVASLSSARTVRRISPRSLHAMHAAAVPLARRSTQAGVTHSGASGTKLRDLRGARGRWAAAFARATQGDSGSSAIQLPHAAVPFAFLEAFILKQDPASFEAAGFIVSPEFGFAFAPDSPHWVTALARHCIGT